MRTKTQYNTLAKSSTTGPGGLLLLKYTSVCATCHMAATGVGVAENMRHHFLKKADV